MADPGLTVLTLTTMGRKVEVRIITSHSAQHSITQHQPGALKHATAYFKDKNQVDLMLAANKGE